MARAKIIMTDKEWESAKYMASIHCTGEEIAGVLQMDYDTLNRNCKEKWNYSISEFIKKHQDAGKMSLRRAQWRAAENGNVSMLIWLGKQWLGQKDKIEHTESETSTEILEEVAKVVRQVRKSGAANKK